MKGREGVIKLDNFLFPRIFFGYSDRNIFHYRWDRERIVGTWKIDTLRPGQNDRHFADTILKSVILSEIFGILNQASLKFSPKGAINNRPALFSKWRGVGQARRHYLNQWWSIFSCRIGLKQFKIRAIRNNFVTNQVFDTWNKKVWSISYRTYCKAYINVRNMIWLCIELDKGFTKERKLTNRKFFHNYNIRYLSH